MAVVFTSQRPLERAENIKAVYEAYTGDKEFIQLDWWRKSPKPLDRFTVMVTDEIPQLSPGKVIMIGHGIAGTKSYGLDQPNAYATRENCDLITYVITQSPELVGQVAGQQGVDESQVLVLGMPRTDVYIGKHKGDGGTGYSHKRVYLYAPTFGTEIKASWQYIDAMLSDDEVLLVKPHMLGYPLLDGEYEHIRAIPSAKPSTPYLIDCDVLITDYSSIMMDALILKKPVVLFTRDEGYLERRGMYFDYPDDYSSRFANNEGDLIDALRSAKWGTDDDTRAQRFVPSCDGYSTERVIDLIRRLE